MILPLPSVLGTKRDELFEVDLETEGLRFLAGDDEEDRSLRPSKVISLLTEESSEVKVNFGPLDWT